MEYDMGITFMREGWLDDEGTGTQHYPDYMMLGSVYIMIKVVGLVRKDIVGFCNLVIIEPRFVYENVGGVKVGALYGKCRQGVHGIR